MWSRRSNRSIRVCVQLQRPAEPSPVTPSVHCLSTCAALAAELPLAIPSVSKHDHSLQILVACVLSSTAPGRASAAVSVRKLRCAIADTKVLSCPPAHTGHKVPVLAFPHAPPSHTPPARPCLLPACRPPRRSRARRVQRRKPRRSCSQACSGAGHSEPAGPAAAPRRATCRATGGAC